MKIKKPKRIERSPTGCVPGQLFGDWAILPEPFRQMVETAKSIDLLDLARRNKAAGGGGGRSDAPSAPLPTQRPDIRQKPYAMEGSIAMIELNGPLTKYSNSFQSLFGGTSTLEVRRQLRLAQQDDEVEGVMLIIDSPGGTTAGTSDLVGEIEATDAAKPCYAYISDLAASAAYWAACGARDIRANATATVGSIGTYCVLQDTTGAQTQDGVKLQVISTGKYKGLGADGKISDDLVDEAQRHVEELNQHFVNGVAQGRAMAPDKARALADGRVHVGQKAQELGLIDDVGSLDDAMQALRQEIYSMKSATEQAASFKAEFPAASQLLIDEGKSAANPERDQQLRQETKAAEVARLNGIMALKGATPDWSIEQFLAGHDLSQAKLNLADKILADAATQQQQVAAAAAAQSRRSAIADRAHPPTTSQPQQLAPNAAGGTGGAIAQVEERIAAWIAGHPGSSRQKATVAVFQADPELQQAYLEEKHEESRRIQQERMQRLVGAPR